MKTVTVDEKGQIDIQVFKDFVDISKVEYYNFKLNDDKTLSLTLYDKDKKLIKPHKPKKKKVKK